MRGPNEWRAERRLSILLTVSCFLFFLLFNHAHFKGSDELAVFEMTRSIAERGQLAIPPLKHTEVGRDGLRYSYFTVGQSLLALPLYALADVARAVLPHAWLRALEGVPIQHPPYKFGGELEVTFVCLYAPIASALLILLFFRFERALGVSLRNALISSLLLAGTSYVALLSTYFLRHTTEAVTILGAFYFYFRWRETGRMRDLILGSCVASATLLIRFPAIIAAPALAGYLGWALLRANGGDRAGRASRASRAGRIVRAAPAIALPLLVALLGHFYFNLLKWGSWFDSPMVGQWARLGNPLYIGIYGFLLSPGASIFVYTPLLLLVPWTFPVMWRAHRAEALALAGLAVCFLFFFASFDGWEGLWSAPGPRYLFIIVPTLMLPLGLWLDQTPGTRAGARKWIVVGGLAAIGLYVQVVSMTVKWGSVPRLAGYAEYQPAWGFLFIPQHSPIAEMSRLFFAGGPLDPWLLSLWHGWEGFPGQPGAALVLFIVWAICFAGCLALLRVEYSRCVGPH